jgi:hypothetical protein
MALVDYSDSESDSESVAQPAAKPAPAAAQSSNATAKKPIQKVVDRSNPRKIVVSLGAATTQDESKTDTNSNEPPTKRAKTGGGVFGGFASLLPPPKNRAQKPTQSNGTSSGTSSGTKPPPRVGVNLKTGATPGFSRSTEDDDGETDSAASKQPSIPDGQKAAEDVTLVGKPLMFKPLSVSRKPKKNVATKMGAAPKAAAAAPVNSAPPVAEAQPNEEPPMKKKKVSLFSISAENDETPDAAPSNGAYEPMFPDETATAADDFAAYDAQYSSAFADPQGSASTAPTATTMSADSLESIASDMNLDAAARRALFGRRGVPAPTQSASRVINFNTDQEYAHNEELRASGEQQIYNPVRAIAPGKHSLRQLVNQVHNQKDALEESFAKAKTNQKEAGQRYGWR